MAKLAPNFLKSKMMFASIMFARRQVNRLSAAVAALSSAVDCSLPSFAPDSTLVYDAHKCPDSWNSNNAVVYRNVLSSEHKQQLEETVYKRASRLRYQRGHWDDVIIDYREFALDPVVDATLLQPIREFLATRHHPFSNDDDGYLPLEWLPTHVIDLKKETGQIHPHVDSVRFSGGLVCGISLLSTAIMRLQLEQENDGNKTGTEQVSKRKDDAYTLPYVDLLLPPGSLYVLQGDGRYRYTHQLLPDNSVFAPGTDQEVIVQRDRRISLILRDDKKKE